MWARVLAIVLIASSVHAQVAESKSTKEPCPDQAPLGPGVTVHERHILMRRGREEDFAVVLCLPQLPSGGCGEEPHPSQTGIVPVSFELEIPDGITVKYRDGRQYRSLVSGTPILYHRGTKVLLLRMRAQADASLGQRKLSGTVTIKTVQAGKPHAIQQIPFGFRIALAGHDVKVEETDWRFGSQVGRHMKDVAMAPLFPFAAILFMVECGTGHCEI